MELDQLAQPAGEEPAPPEEVPAGDLACPICKGQGFLRFDVPVGHPNFGRAERCPHPSHGAEQLDRLAALSGLSPADLACRLEDIKPNSGNRPMLRAAGAMLARPYGWLYIWGPPGNGKTSTLMALVNGFNASGYGPAMYLTFSRLLDWMRDAFEQDLDPAAGRYSSRFRQALGLKALAIDELDKVRDTAFVTEFRLHFLDERYRQALAGESVTIFASNASPSTLPQPIYDRIRDGRFRIVQNCASSARPTMGKGGTNADRL